MNKLVFGLLLLVSVGSQTHAGLGRAPIVYNVGHECVYITNNTVIPMYTCTSDALPATVKVLTLHKMSTPSGQKVEVETVSLQTMTVSGALVFHEATRLKLSD